MSEENNIANTTLEYLRRFDKKIDHITEEMKDMKFRFGSLERNVASLHESMAHHSIRLDRIEDRLSRIEKRLDLVDA